MLTEAILRNRPDGSTLILLVNAVKCRCGVMALMLRNVGGRTLCVHCATKAEEVAL